jgi:hypothetical protein
LTFRANISTCYVCNTQNSSFTDNKPLIINNLIFSLQGQCEVRRRLISICAVLACLGILSVGCGVENSGGAAARDFHVVFTSDIQGYLEECG